MKKTLIALALTAPLLAYAVPESCMFLHAYLSQHPEVDDVAGYKQKCADDTELEAAKAKLPGVVVGMPAQTVLQASNWGKPDKVNTTITKYGRDEQWVYEGSGYLYFSNGKLTAIQHSR